MNSQNPVSIESIRIEGLFGLYTYALPPAENFGDAAILYGDNGVGKSTILRLAFHMLSAAENKGHRNALYKTTFHALEIRLSTGVTLHARRGIGDEEELLFLSVSKDGADLAIWNFKPSNRISPGEGEEIMVEMIDKSSGIARVVTRRVRRHRERQNSAVPYGEQAYLNALRSHAPRVFILHAERRLESDFVSDPGDEIELRRLMRYEESKKFLDLISRSRAIALSQALNTAARWLQSRAVQGANAGSINVQGVYANVLKHLSVPYTSITPIAIQELNFLSERLTKIEKISNDFSQYELATPLKTREFITALSSQQNPYMASSVVRPYVESVESRFAALDPIYRLIDKLVTTLNGFLSDKSVTFTLSQGFNIQNRLGQRLEPGQLSSGEQQLILLFCYVLTARDQPSIFMINEPEISLNVKWQRQLVQSLLDITKEATIQFIFASHSMELLGQHRNRVVALTNIV